MRIQTLDVQDGVQPVIAGPGSAPIKANVYGIANECTEGIPDNRDKGQGFVQIGDDLNKRNQNGRSLALTYGGGVDVLEEADGRQVLN